MAIAEVGAGTQRNVVDTTTAVDSHTNAFPANVTAGSLLLNVGAGWRAGSPYTAVAVTDTLGTVYTAVVADFIFWASGYGVGWIAYGIAPSSGACTQTVNPNVGTGTIISCCDEFSGVDPTPLDVNGGNSTSTGTSASDGIVTGVDGALIVGLLSVATGTTITPSSLTAIYEKEGGAGQPSAAAFKIGVTAGAETLTWALGVSRLWNVHTLSFKPTVAAPPSSAFPYTYHYYSGR